MEKCYLRRASFNNCQSLRDVTYEFIDGINVITAPNSTGKSVFYKALKVAVGATFFSNTELNHLISYGETQAIACFEFSDGSSGGFIASVVPGVKRVRLQYVYKDANTVEFTAYNEPAPEFIRKMSVVLDDKTTFIMNVLDPDQELLFVNSNETTNSSIIKLVSDNQTLEELEPIVDMRMGGVRATLERMGVVSTNVDNRLASLDVGDINKLRDQVAYGESLVTPCKDYVYVAKQIESITPVEVVDYTTAEVLLDYFANLEMIWKTLKLLETCVEFDFDKVQTLCDLMDTVTKTLEFVYQITTLEAQDTKSLDKMLDYVGTLQTTLGLLEQLEQENRVGVIDVEGMVCTYTQLCEMHTLLVDMDECGRVSTSLSSELSHLQDEISTQFESVSCPIKGDVFYSEEGCLRRT